ncbi:hypothetical protein [Bradyrhizobium sp. HKCCYLRH1065]|uniref:hypothetical protein n=1 Tax=unclassified Bradyrhizobium TaxID=2631580 RepID=UPI003EBD9890
MYENTPARKEYQAGVRAEFFQTGAAGTVVIGFATNPDGERRQSYRVYVTPSDFEEIVREMMKADPKQTIRAFGVALKDFA